MFTNKLTIFKLLFLFRLREIEDHDCQPVYEEKCTKETQHSYDLEYEDKCHPVKKRVCHATVAYGYLRSRIQLMS